MSDVAEMVAWLRREIETDKAAALATNSGPWRTTDDQDDFDGDILIGYVTLRADDGTALADDRSGALAEEDLRHVARHDPQDVIARCNAELAALDEHDDDSGQCSTCSNYDPTGLHDGGAPYPCRTVRLLAQGYRHRDGWKDEWATSTTPPN